MCLRRVLGAVAVLAVALTVACGPEPAADQDAGKPESSSPAPSGTESPSQEPTDPESPAVTEVYAVPDPGPRKGPVTVADVLVQADDTIPDDVVDAVRRLPGVVAVASISVINVPLENKGYTLAAVDPGVYRTFVEAGSADFADQWRRLAGGEVAVSKDLYKKLPTDNRGYIDLPMAEGGTAKAHVGSYAAQVEQVDLVVNDKFGEALGAVPGNALLINTGATSPSSLRGPIERAVGTLAVQNLDAVARFGLDPDAVQSAVLVGSFADAVGVFNYTPIGGGRIEPDPAWVREHIVTQPVPILGSVTCNKYLMPQLTAALQQVQQMGLADEIHPDEYAGCYYPRFIAGSTKLSNHSYGLALDFNVPGNQRGTVGEMNREVVAIFKQWGFAWGGDWSYTDPMHFELDRLVKPG